MMLKKYFFLFISIVVFQFSFAQTVQQKLTAAVNALRQDPQMKHASMSLYVVETKTGKPVYALNEQVGLAPASTQKLFTSVASFEMLGNDYAYQTNIGYDGSISNNTLTGNIYIVGAGDPSLGSFRFNSTKREVVLSTILNALQKAGIKKIDGDIILDDSKFSYQPLPGGWIWDDIGNYYGAGTWALNWNENQYDLVMNTGSRTGDSVTIVKTDPELEVSSFKNLLTTGKPGSGDNGYIYLPPYSANAFVTGTEAAGQKNFAISGSIPFPAVTFAKELENYFIQNNITVTGSFKNSETINANKAALPTFKNLLTTITSPTFDTLNYWFLQKSINLYGEAFAKTLALEKNGMGITDSGVEIIKDFWAGHGIERAAINIIDGSGLSPQNRVTTNAMVTVLQFAQTRPWFQSFYNALPVYNNIKMKSGTINGAKAFAGYQTSKSGMQYTFAIIINNFDTDAGSIVPKMYKVLDVLK